jgi:hypothetical protein
MPPMIAFKRVNMASSDSDISEHDQRALLLLSQMLDM